MISEHKFVRMEDGAELHAEIKEIGSSVWLICTHGIGEHLARHSYLPELFGSNFNVFQYDLRGHGRSMGEKVYISDFWVYMDDLSQIVHYLKKRYKMKRYILFGHSMGALITAGFMQKKVDKDFYPERVFLNAPPVGFPGILGEALKLTPLLLKGFLTQLPLSVKLGGLVDLDFLSHDVFIKENYQKDPLNAQKLHSKLLLEMVKASGEIFSKPLRIDCPGYVTVGSEDKVVNVDALLHYFKEVEKGFQLREFYGAYHEIHNEIEKYKTPYFEFLKECILEETFNGD